ncbi:MAG TPA: hypothetical protein VGX68_06415 [Thermoanaerobaculia bacterium]|jgi:hypothetical protein|nr:hypothetical protein [Thermoanaerobaculia bacterium]
MDIPTQPQAPPSRLLTAFNELLLNPLSLLERAGTSRGGLAFLVLAGSVCGYLFYGAAAGFFQGGTQILVAAMKAPIIIVLSLLLCLPSLFVFSAMAGARWTRRTFLFLLAGFAGTLALLLLALLPVSWLFSASSRHLASVVFLQFILWLAALLLTWRFLGRVLTAMGARTGAMFLWLLLFCVVSLQVTTMLRPVLERKPGGALFVSGKKSFLEQMGDVFDD